MASPYSNTSLLHSQHQAPPSAAALRWWPHRGRNLLPRRRRRRLPILRLGQQRQKNIFSLGRVFRRIRVRWMKMQYICLMKKLKRYYKNLIKDLVEASASTELMQQRMMMEASFAVPVMGLSHHYGGHLNRPRSVFMF